MIRTARKSSDLAKRVRRFLWRERRRDRSLSSLLDCLESRRDVYLYGGVLRDIALYGISNVESDIDLVCVGSRDVVGAVVREDRFRFRENKFGGFRAETERWFVDLWHAEETWAFREGGCEYRGVESLLGVTITNWESILCRLDGHRLIHGENYFRDLNKRYLHVVLERNPNPLGMYVRIMRAYACKEAAVLSGKAAEVVGRGLQMYSFADIRAYESGHYRIQYIGEGVYELFRRRLMNPGSRPVELRGARGSLL